MLPIILLPLTLKLLIQLYWADAVIVIGLVQDGFLVNDTNSMPVCASGLVIWTGATAVKASHPHPGPVWVSTMPYVQEVPLTEALILEVLEVILDGIALALMVNAVVL